MKIFTPNINTSLEQFKLDFPNLIVGNDTNKQYTINSAIEEIEGKWSFTFKENKLFWYIFNAYEYNFSKQTFNIFLESTNKIIDLFSKKFGNPFKIESKNLVYIDPFVKRHYGYNVKSALWSTPNTDFKVQFKFSGSRGDYYFLLKIDFHAPNYEYF